MLSGSHRSWPSCSPPSTSEAGLWPCNFFFPLPPSPPFLPHPCLSPFFVLVLCFLRLPIPWIFPYVVGFNDISRPFSLVPQQAVLGHQDVDWACGREPGCGSRWRPAAVLPPT